MENREIISSPQRNPITHERHRREVFWQITFPLLLGVSLLLVLGVLAGLLGGAQDHSRWAAVSLIWLIMLTLAGSFIFLIVIAGISYGLIRLIQVLPGGFLKVQDFFVMVSVRVADVGDKMVEPVLRTKTWTASAGRLKRELGGTEKREEQGGERASDE